MRSQILTLTMPEEHFRPLLREAIGSSVTWADATMMNHSFHHRAGQIRFLVSAPAAERIIQRLHVTPETAPGLVYLSRGLIDYLASSGPGVAAAWVPRPLDEEPPVEESPPLDENEEHRLNPGDVLPPGFGGKW